MERVKGVWGRPGFLIRRLHQIQVAAFLMECSESEVTPVQWGILTIVAQRPGIGHIEISEELGLDRSNVANVINRLVRRGLLRQRLNATDRRKKEITLLKAGHNLISRVEVCAQRAQQKVLAPLTDKEREVFVELMTRLIRENNHLGRTMLRMS